ncbi:SDR family oxidoreductase [Paenibacillus caseinilyticus]|uniref:Dehydrogenase n=1 Tax=Paenibacillus mucilaginosus K02 TaxID=997761 RepID=I0BH84_9BACL|nr:SDR family oxidoreductase [Paenibacillus mucilaginosus]AFH61731.1 dehydrogenase [Paenibacillus mucilaginosus K02]
MSQNSNKIALITGANKGIGFETARRLGQQGITILVGARNKDRGQDAAAKLCAEGVDACFLELEVTNPDSITAAAKEIDEQYGKLDILINNVGIVTGNPETILIPSQTDLKLLKAAFETNFFSMFAVTQSMLPLIHRSDAGRIVNMSSGLGSLTQQSDPTSEFYDHKIFLYNSTKTAVNTITVHLAYELRHTKIKINSADPGFTATDLNGFRGTRTVEQAATVVIRLATLAEDGPTGGFFDENGALSW